MSLHCFFGVQVCADGVPVTPPMPPNSLLVVTQCALTSPQAGAVTLYVQSHDQPKRFAVCTLDTECDIFYAPLQLIFAQKVSFTLVPAKGESSGGGMRPVVHLTGYFECDEDQSDGTDGDSMDDDDDDDGDDYDGAKGGNKWQRHEEEPEVRSKRASGERRERLDASTRQHQQQDSGRSTNGGKNKSKTGNKRRR